MDQMFPPTVSAIKEVPGLYISDRFSARSVSNLKAHNVARILSLVPPQQVPYFGHQEGQEDLAFEIKNINIDDDPTEDILTHLQDACDWIQEGLAGNPDGRNGVLVHCSQGISRSGSIIVAYLMRELQMPFSDALALAQASRPIIYPNKGFLAQLQIWEDCQFNVFTEEKTEKEVYKAWKEERDRLFKLRVEDVNKHRYSSMAATVAHFGAKKQEAKDHHQ